MTAYVLVGGAWLGGWCWQAVSRGLHARGHDVYAVTLTGLGERVHLARPDIDLDTHIADVVNLLDYEDLADVRLVGHSYGGSVITGVADRRPERLARLVYVDTAPLADGQTVLDWFPPEGRAQVEKEVTELGDGWRWPLRPFEQLGQTTSLAGLSEAQLERFQARATPHPFGTFKQPLHLSRSLGGAYRRVGILCTAGGLSLSNLTDLIASGDSRFRNLDAPDWSFHELPTGHWPMFSAPDLLADLLHQHSVA